MFIHWKAELDYSAAFQALVDQLVAESSPREAVAFANQAFRNYISATRYNSLIEAIARSNGISVEYDSNRTLISDKTVKDVMNWLEKNLENRVELHLISKDNA